MFVCDGYYVRLRVRRDLPATGRPVTAVKPAVRVTSGSEPPASVHPPTAGTNPNNTTTDLNNLMFGLPNRSCGQPEHRYRGAQHLLARRPARLQPMYRGVRPILEDGTRPMTAAPRGATIDVRWIVSASGPA